MKLTKEESREKALRFNKGKPKYSLIDYKSLEPMVRALEFGAEKYGRNNWKNNFPMEELIDSLMRHVAEINQGNTIDPESKVPHIGHIMANAMFIAYHSEKESHGE